MCNPRNVSMNLSRAVGKYELPLDELQIKLKRNLNSYKQLLRITIHGLCNTHAIILLSKSENYKIISERLGHTSVKFTIDTYSHVLLSIKKQTVDSLYNIFNIL